MGDGFSVVLSSSLRGWGRGRFCILMMIFIIVIMVIVEDVME